MKVKRGDSSEHLREGNTRQARARSLMTPHVIASGAQQKFNSTQEGEANGQAFRYCTKRVKGERKLTVIVSRR